jgi:hypothetical protein
MLLCMPSAQPPLRFTNRHGGSVEVQLRFGEPEACAECAHMFS